MGYLARSVEPRLQLRDSAGITPDFPHCPPGFRALGDLCAASISFAGIVHPQALMVKCPDDLV